VKGVKTAFRSGCRSVVLVHEAAETIAAADVAAPRLRDLFRLGRLKREFAVGAFAVVVLDVDGRTCSRWRRPMISSQSRRSLRTVRTNRSA
jgi:hypothetical protein